MTTPQNGATATTPAAPGFGALLRTTREARGLSQAQLAKRAGCDHTQISRMEAGTRNPYPDLVRRLATALEADPEPLLLAAADSMGYLSRRLMRHLEREYYGKYFREVESTLPHHPTRAHDGSR